MVTHLLDAMGQDEYNERDKRESSHPISTHFLDAMRQGGFDE